MPNTAQQLVLEFTGAIAELSPSALARAPFVVPVLVATMQNDFEGTLKPKVRALQALHKMVQAEPEFAAAVVSHRGASPTISLFKLCTSLFIGAISARSASAGTALLSELRQDLLALPKMIELLGWLARENRVVQTQFLEEQGFENLIQFLMLVHEGGGGVSDDHLQIFRA